MRIRVGVRRPPNMDAVEIGLVKYENGRCFFANSVEWIEFPDGGHYKTLVFPQGSVIVETAMHQERII